MEILTETPDRVKLPLSFDAARMKAEYDAMELHPFIYYSVIIMGLPDPDKPDAHVTSKYFRRIVDYFNTYTKVTQARLLRLEPGSEVKEHCDPMLGLEIENSVVRLTIPISGQSGVEFYLNDTIVPMQVGECWYLNLTDRHRILHRGTEDRVNYTIDMVANAWVRDAILTGTL